MAAVGYRAEQARLYNENSVSNVAGTRGPFITFFQKEVKFVRFVEHTWKSAVKV